jgi:hypothetical protein
MASNCRHIMPSGCQCQAHALQGEDLCYFHSRRRHVPGKPADRVEIPLLEDRCAVQITITQVLRAVVNKTIERPQAQLLIYGLQLALQSVDRRGNPMSYKTVEAISESSEGEELAADPDEEEDDEDDEDEETDSDESDEEEDGSEDDDSEDADSDDDDEDDDGLNDESTDELVADAKYLQSVSNALDVGDMRLAARLLKE